MNSSHPHAAAGPFYLATIVTIARDGVLRPARDSVETGQHIHVITAWNPGEERPTRAENDAANERLRGDLAALGLVPIPARGSDPCSDHFEESWAVHGIDDATARDIGARHGQWAVFRITHDEQRVLGCFGSWELARPLPDER